MLLFWIASASAHCTVVINELLPDALGVDTANEWVELLNTGDDPCDLTGYSLEAGASGFNSMVTFGEITFPAGDYLQIGGDGADVPASLTMGNASTNADGLRLVAADGMVVDVVIYGSPNEDEWPDESGFPALSLAPSPYGGSSLGRCPNGIDSNQAGEDFVSFPVPTPGATNDMAEPCGFVDTGIADTGDTADTGRVDTGDSAAEDSAAPVDTADTGAVVVVERPCGCAAEGGAPGGRLLLYLFIGFLSRKAAFRL